MVGRKKKESMKASADMYAMNKVSREKKRDLDPSTGNWASPNSHATGNSITTNLASKTGAQAQCLQPLSALRLLSIIQQMTSMNHLAILSVIFFPFERKITVHQSHIRRVIAGLSVSTYVIHIR